jgi:hypothetical protein
MKSLLAFAARHVPAILRSPGPPAQSNRYSKMLVAMVPLVLGSSVAFAQAGTGKLASASIDELKQVYLVCDRTASRQILDMESAAYCSSVGEALQKRAFDGSFDQLLAWWRVEKHAASAPPARPPMERDSR